MGDERGGHPVRASPRNLMRRRSLSMVECPGVNSMVEQTITAMFSDNELAESAIGRLEVLGVPARDIAKSSATGHKIEVTAKVEDRLAEKAALILRVDRNSKV